MMCDKSKKINTNNAFCAMQKKRIVWILAVGILVGLMALAAWLEVRTRADEGIGNGARERRSDQTDAVVEPLGKQGSIPDPSADPPVWRPCPWDGEGESICAPDTSSDGEESGETAPLPLHPREEMIYHSRPNDRMEIALSFDDGPHPRLTPVILSILEEYGIKATFFMVGETVGYYPAAARAVAEAGHEIGNHTFSHRKFDRLNEEDLRREISSCEEAISAVSDAPVRFIRPPEGQMSDTMRQVIGEMDYRVILWDVDTRDWAHTSPEAISRHILDTVQAGDIILMHDFIGYDSPTPAALRLVIPALLERGFHFVTVGDLVEAD